MTTGRKRFVRIALITAAILATVQLTLTAGLFWAMCQPPDKFGAVMKHVPMPLMMVLPFESLWNRARGGSLNPGDPAPDFRLPTLDHTGFVTLSEMRGSRPVVLIFGSYT